MTRYRLILIPLLLFHIVFVFAAFDKDDKEEPDAKGKDAEEEADVDSKQDKADSLETSKSKSKTKPKTESNASKDPKSKTKSTTAAPSTSSTAKPTTGAKSASHEDEDTFDVMSAGRKTTKLPKKPSPWEKMPNAPTFVGHLIVPYPTSNFISLTMKQAYVLYLWLQVRRMKEIFKESSDGVTPDDKLNPDDINTMIADYSKTGFLKLPLPYKPPLFLPTDTENIEGDGEDRDSAFEPFSLSADHTDKAAVTGEGPPETKKTTLEIPAVTKKPPEAAPGSKKPPSAATASKKPPHASDGLKKPPIAAALENLPPPPTTGSQNFPPPSTKQFPSFPAYRSQVYAKKNPKELPSQPPQPGVVSFPSKVKPQTHAVYPTPQREELDSQIYTHMKVPLQGPSLSKARPARKKRRFFQRVSNYMNQLGADGKQIRRK